MINLLPPEYLKQQQTNWKKGLVIGLIVIILLVVSVTSLRLILHNRELENKLAITESKLQEVNRELEDLPALESEKNKLESRLKNRARIKDRQLDWLEIMHDLELLMPSEVWLQRFNISLDRSFSLEGYVLRTQVSTLIESLTASAYFSNLEVDYVEQQELNYTDYQEDEATFFRLHGKIDESKGEQ
ncbi:PilN domain-containing protein [Fuchsiella alkaliacetigena]|uniref:PilN domain-containing protein n=1 Tax=Fuchsiella alkaliacetigena TaxID=957042 RepID=UPI00200A7073|nr:PilN domain-containing protein [Fuchsiella alkaliacetigena]MCK8825287.1 PilN domain-containing protein [Fuchsiella alkaliacetigena]